MTNGITVLWTAAQFLAALSFVAIALGCCAAAWAFALVKLAQAMNETLYVVAWLTYKGWAKAHGKTAKEMLEIAIRADHAAKGEER